MYMIKATRIRVNLVSCLGAMTGVEQGRTTRYARNDCTNV